MHVLALNSGSSSLKFGLYRTGASGALRLLDGEIEGIGSTTGIFRARDIEGRAVRDEPASIPDAEAAVKRMGQWLADLQAPSPQSIGHRIVHGGPRLREHRVIDAGVQAELELAVDFAPLHIPAALAVIRYATAHFPGLPQVACLDTCFHAAMPSVASTLPLPLELRAAGLRRYGFHGLSCESIVRQLAGSLPARVLIAHLGNGASVTAVRDGASIDTSMGLTPTGGLIMGTRSGDLDPGVLVHLLRQRHLDATAVEDLVNHRCGLRGISGIGGDMRALHAAEDAHPEARLAIEMFCYAAAKTLGAMSVALGGAELIVFTGGIGEHDDRVRAEVCARLSCLGVKLDAALNRHGVGRISSAGSRCGVQVLPSQEDEQIAHHTWVLCRAPPA